MDKLNNDFIHRATKVSSFNLIPSDFQKMDYKKEIQHLYQNHTFGAFDPSMALKSIDKREFNNLVKLLKKDNFQQFQKLHYLPLKGIGPSEAVFFLLTENGILGGGSSAGTDLIIGSKKYEIKAAEWHSVTAKDYVSNFKLGGNIPGLTSLMVDLQELAYATGATTSKKEINISKTKMAAIKKGDPSSYEKIRQRYKKMAYDYYFKGHETIFVQNKSNQPDFGEIITIKNVMPDDIEMERLTSGTIKPIIRVK